jgi:hypothetical protein
MAKALAEVFSANVRRLLVPLATFRLVDGAARLVDAALISLRPDFRLGIMS